MPAIAVGASRQVSGHEGGDIEKTQARAVAVLGGCDAPGARPEFAAEMDPTERAQTDAAWRRRLFGSASPTELLT